MKSIGFASVVVLIGSVVACSASDPTGNTNSDLVICKKTSCGPELGMPSVICWDGSTAGPTGQCISTTADPACHWQITQCPPDPCTTKECGPEPLLEVRCADGGIESPVCERTNGVCGWHIDACDDPCTPQECGPEPLLEVRCADGGIESPVCERTNGVCGWKIAVCQ